MCLSRAISSKRRPHYHLYYSEFFFLLIFMSDTRNTRKDHYFAFGFMIVKKKKGIKKSKRVLGKVRWKTAALSRQRLLQNWKSEWFSSITSPLLRTQWFMTQRTEWKELLIPSFLAAVLTDTREGGGLSRGVDVVVGGGGGGGCWSRLFIFQW